MDTRKLHRLGIPIAAAFAAILAGCDDNNSKTPPEPKRPSEVNPPPAPDNTGKNVRDRDADAKTPMTQGETQADLTITQAIRKAVMAEPDMSVNGQNVKIITKDGVVTLRGPVSTQTEKDTIETRAKAVAGVTKVVNELEVTGK